MKCERDTINARFLLEFVTKEKHVVLINNNNNNNNKCLYSS